MERSVKTMLFGIAIMLLGIYIQGEEGIRLYGGEFYIVILGFLITLAGLFMDKVIWFFTDRN
ncbi:hypothetical protein ACFO9Q_21675 [Paenibacillus sp. GCM10023252]|uniref:hypothetical protein n=1 Tax=Paenibacillus sp. GCM10023252 TaxID=3252649 RepID=UPI003605ACFE